MNDPTPEELEAALEHGMPTAEPDLAKWQRAELAIRLKQVEYALADMTAKLPGLLAEVRAIRAEIRGPQ